MERCGDDGKSSSRAIEDASKEEIAKTKFSFWLAN